MPEPKNDRNLATVKLCLALEGYRREEEGRVRTADELVQHFFPHDEARSEDKLFFRMPKEVRGPLLAAWGIRGIKAALRDDDDKVRSVVHDALVAGDIDSAAFEETVTAELLADWIPQEAYWAFWRGGKLSPAVVRRALTFARELGLYDARWLLATLTTKGGRLTGIDALTDVLGKDQLAAWLRRIHEAKDASPRAMLEALGWDVAFAALPVSALLELLDAMAKARGLVAAPAAPTPASDRDAAGTAPSESASTSREVGAAPSDDDGAPERSTIHPAAADEPASGANASASAERDGERDGESSGPRSTRPPPTSRAAGWESDAEDAPPLGAERVPTGEWPDANRMRPSTPLQRIVSPSGGPPPLPGSGSVPLAAASSAIQIEDEELFTEEEGPRSPR